MIENPNIDKKDEILQYVYTLESDEFTKIAAKKKEKISQVEKLVDCKVCGKKT